jgi:hypothetical protein
MTARAISPPNEIDIWLEEKIENIGGAPLLQAYARMLEACREFEIALARVMWRDDEWFEQYFPPPKLTVKRD